MHSNFFGGSLQSIKRYILVDPRHRRIKISLKLSFFHRWRWGNQWLETHISKNSESCLNSPKSKIYIYNICIDIYFYINCDVYRHIYLSKLWILFSNCPKSKLSASMLDINNVQFLIINTEVREVLSLPWFEQESVKAAIFVVLKVEIFFHFFNCKRCDLLGF